VHSPVARKDELRRFISNYVIITEAHDDEIASRISAVYEISSVNFADIMLFPISLLCQCAIEKTLFRRKLNYPINKDNKLPPVTRWFERICINS